MDLAWLKALYEELGRIEGYLYTIVHPNLVVAKILEDSVGLRLYLAAVLINFAMQLFKMMVTATNTVSHSVQTLAVTDDLSMFVAAMKRGDPSTGTWEVITTALLAGGYGVLALAYLVRYAVLIVLAVTAPLAALFFMLPETNHLAKMWTTHFTTNLLMQPAPL